MPSNRRLKTPPGRTGSLARGSYNFRQQSLRRSRCEHGGVGFGPVGRPGLVRGSCFSFFSELAVEPGSSVISKKMFLYIGTGTVLLTTVQILLS